MSYLKELCDEHLVEGVTGALSFSKGFYPKLCSQLGIRYKDLSRTGKAILKADAIETTGMRYNDYFKEGSYYQSK